MARGLKFRIKEEEGLYYPYSKNKGADQLRGYPEADLRLCFRISKNPVLSRRGSNYTFMVLYFYKLCYKPVIGEPHYKLVKKVCISELEYKLLLYSYNIE